MHSVTQLGPVTDTDNLGGMSKALHTLIVSEDILGCTEDIGLPNNLSEASLCDPLCNTVDFVLFLLFYILMRN